MCAADVDIWSGDSREENGTQPRVGGYSMRGIERAKLGDMEGLWRRQIWNRLVDGHSGSWTVDDSSKENRKAGGRRGWNEERWRVASAGCASDGDGDSDME